MGTFGSFGTVRLGIYAAQKGLDVTGNNITNINTVGYTRQRLNQVSLIPSAADRYYSVYKNRIGQGAVITGIDQLRDPSLDTSYRKATADVGSANAKLEGLNRLATILDEVGKGDLEQDDGVILNQLNDLRDLISKAVTSGVGTYDSLIRGSADALAKLFNSYADDLADLKADYENKLDQQITEVNDILKGIRELNVAIRNADIRGDEALELRDQRNLLLDELNQYVKVDIKYSMEDVGAGTMVEKLTISLATGDKNTLVDGEYATEFGRNLQDESYSIILGPLEDRDGAPQDPNQQAVTLGGEDLYGSLQSIRNLLTGKGEYATTAQELEALKKEYEAALTTQTGRVNNILQRIQDLNTAIYQNPPLTVDEINQHLKERSELLEELNHYVNVDMTGVQGSVEAAGDLTAMNVSLKLPDGSVMTLVDNTKAGVASFAQGAAAAGYPITVTDADGVVKTLSEDDTSGSLSYLQGQLNQTADTDLAPGASSNRGIPYYQMMLDNLAYEFAQQMNELNNTGLEGSGNLFSIGSDTNDAAIYIKPGDPTSGELVRITASNISVSHGWKNESISIQATADPNAASGDTSRLAEFLALFNEKIDFDPSDINVGAGGDAYHGTFEDMLLRIQSTLAEDQKTTDAVLTNYVVTMDDIYVDREGVMGVDLNDEATSLMTYQKAYTAACRLMTTLQEALDSLINGTAV